MLATSYDFPAALRLDSAARLLSKLISSCPAAHLLKNLVSSHPEFPESNRSTTNVPADFGGIIGGHLRDFGSLVVSAVARRTTFALACHKVPRSARSLFAGGHSLSP